MFNLDVLFSPSNIIIFMAIFTRLTGLLMSAPLFSTYPIPMQVKIWLAATIAFILFPIVQYNSAFAMPTSAPALTLILIKELLRIKKNLFLKELMKNILDGDFITH